MFCELCKEKIVMKRHIDNLFRREFHHICENCYMHYPIFPRFEVIPVQEATLYHHVLSTINHQQNPLAYMSMLKPFYIHYLTSFKHASILCVDILDDPIYHMLDQMRFGDLFVISLYENIEEKGEYL